MGAERRDAEAICLHPATMAINEYLSLYVSPRLWLEGVEPNTLRSMPVFVGMANSPQFFCN